MRPQNPISLIVRKTSSAAVKATPGRVMGVLLFGGSGNSSIKFTNDASGVATPLLDVNVLAATTKFVDLTDVGGVYFDTAIYAVLAGTGGLASIWYD
jgi:hypothetical protein